MAEYGVGAEPRQENVSFSDQIRAIVDWFVTPDDTGNLIPPTVAKSIGEELDDQINGRADNGYAEKKGIEKAVEKVLRAGRFTDVFEKLLFGDRSAGGPDPAQRGEVRFTGADGRTFTFNAEGELVEVKMLPMWNADP